MAKKKNWLRVIFVRTPNEPEALPVSFLEDCGEYAVGILEMEPQQDFGCHKGDKVEFFPLEVENQDSVLICDMNPMQQFSEAELEGGSILKKAISTFNTERNERNFLEVLLLLRDSNVWIPCNTVMSEADHKQLEEQIASLDGNLEKLEGMEFMNLDEIRLIPDILQNGDALFFPVFSGIEEMGEYGNNFSKVEKHFLDAMIYAKNNENDLSGIVVNAFTEPFVLDKELWEAVENLDSRLSK